MTAKGILRIPSGTVLHDVTQEAWCTSYKLEASYRLHASDLVKYVINEHNTSYEKSFEVP